MSIFDYLPPGAAKKADADGYAMLKEQGYDVSGVATSSKKRKRLKMALKNRGEELTLKTAVDKEKGAILIWFELNRGDETIARSKGVKFVKREDSNN